MIEDWEANLYKNFGFKWSKNATFLKIELYMINNRSHTTLKKKHKKNINNYLKSIILK